MLNLVLPSKEYLETVKSGVREFAEMPSDFDTYSTKRILQYFKNDFNSYLTDMEATRKGIGLKIGGVPDTELWLILDEKFIGLFNLRHRLTDEMMGKGIGHIGYEIIPSMRRKGYAKAGIILALNYFKNVLELDKILITCKENNIPSVKTALSIMNLYGGKEDIPIQIENLVKRRFWVNTRAAR